MNYTNILTILAVLLPASPLAAQITGNDLSQRCGGAYNLCGFVAADSKEIVIPFQYEYVSGFHGELALVKIDGKYGYISPDGTVAIAPTLEMGGDFRLGLAEARIDGRVGVIDATGRWVVEPQFKRAIPYTAEVILVVEGDPWGTPRPYSDLSGSMFTERNMGLYHIERGMLAEAKYRFKLFDGVGAPVLWATEGSLYEGVYGLMRIDGTWMLEPSYMNVKELSEGLAVVAGIPGINGLVADNTGRGPSGAINAQGELVVPLQYNRIMSWRNGRALVFTAGRESYGLLNRQGSLIGGRYFDEIKWREGDDLPLVLEEGVWKTLMPNGDVVEDQLNGEVAFSCPSGLSFVRMSGGIQIYHEDIGLVSDVVFAGKRDYQYTRCDRPVSISVDDKWGYVTQSGTLINDPLDFDVTYGFVGEYTAVGNYGEVGIINRAGEVTAPFVYTQVIRRDDEVFSVSQGERWFWIDPFGNEIPDPASIPKDRSYVLSCFGGLVRFQEDGLWGMKDAAGEVLIAPQYRAISCFGRGVAWVAAVEADRWCPIGPGGGSYSDEKCRISYYPYAMTHATHEVFDEDSYESSVLWVRALLDFGQGARLRPPGFVPDGEAISTSVVQP